MFHEYFEPLIGNETFEYEVLWKFALSYYSFFKGWRVGVTCFDALFLHVASHMLVKVLPICDGNPFCRR